MRRSGERERGGEPVTPGLSAIMRWYQPVTRTICTLWSMFRLLLVLFKPGMFRPVVRRHGSRDSFCHVVSTRSDGNIHKLVSACKKLEWPKMQKNETYFLSSRPFQRVVESTLDIPRQQTSGDSAFNVRDASRRDQHINQDRRPCSQRHDLHIY